MKKGNVFLKDSIDEINTPARMKMKMNEIIKAIEEVKLKEILFGEAILEPATHNPGRSECGMHVVKAAANENEDRILKCLYYKNKNSAIKHCETCDLKDLYHIVGDYKIANYRVPAFYSAKDDKGKDLGEIDLIISDGNIEYATEIRGYRKENGVSNKDTLLKMIIQILTYSYGFTNYKPAIGFFENSFQYTEWLEYKDDIVFNNLLSKADISVFMFTKTGDDNKLYKLEKLK